MHLFPHPFLVNNPKYRWIPRPRVIRNIAILKTELVGAALMDVAGFYLELCLNQWIYLDEVRFQEVRKDREWWHCASASLAGRER